MLPRWIVGLAALLAVAAIAAGFAAFAQNVRADEPDAESSRTVERPFGGPPNRVPRQRGRRCVTEQHTCTLAKPEEVGSDCSCVEAGGRKIKGKIEK